MAYSLNWLCEQNAKADPSAVDIKIATASDLARIVGLSWPEISIEQWARLPYLLCVGSFDNASLERAADTYLKSYLQSLTPLKRYQNSSLRFEAAADAMVPKLRFSACMRLIKDRADFCQYVLHLPYLAEAYQRCAVWQCRRALDELRRDVDLQKTPELGSAVEAEANLLLAEQINSLGDLYVAHGKYQIAERAYADAVSSVESACRLDPNDSNYQILESRYLIWSKYLTRINKEYEARNVLERMLSTFAWAG